GRAAHEAHLGWRTDLRFEPVAELSDSPLELLDQELHQASTTLDWAPHDSRTMTSEGNTTSRPCSEPPPAMRSSSNCAATVPNVTAGWGTTVRNGYRIAISSMSSNATRAISRGTFRPRSRIA